MAVKKAPAKKKKTAEEKSREQFNQLKAMRQNMQKEKNQS